MHVPIKEDGGFYVLDLRAFDNLLQVYVGELQAVPICSNTLEAAAVGLAGRPLMLSHGCS